MNLYDVLGVSPESDTAAIKRAYLDAARRHHPDFHADADDATRVASARRMQELNRAWEVLGDPIARAAYDREQLTSADPGVARRAASEPEVPDGKGWTPRLGDDGWMTDFEAWADDDEFPPDEPRSARRDALAVLPIGLIALAVVSGFVGMAVGLKELVALGAVCLILAAGLFLLLPMFEMSRSRQR